MRKLKICNIGWANSIHVARLMKWLVTKGYDISIITDNPKEIDGVKNYKIPPMSRSFGIDTRPRLKRYLKLSFNDYRVQKLRYFVKRILWIRNLVDKIKPDIIHSHSLWYPGYLGIYMKGYPFVLTVLNGDVLWTKSDINYYDRGIWVTMRTKWGIKKADIITGESQALIDACIKKGANKNKVHITRAWGVDFKIFNHYGDKKEIRYKLRLPEESKIVLSPRNTGSKYNLDKIVKAIPGVISKIKEVYFVFIWPRDNPEKEKELTNMASKLGVRENVKIVGFVNHDKVALYHKVADVMVSVSQYDSGPIALKESMACGDVPVISDLPSVREWITDGWNGILVDPNNVDQIANSIIRLLEDDQMMESFAERNWKLIHEKGDQEYWMKRMEELYYSLIHKKEKNIL